MKKTLLIMTLLLTVACVSSSYKDKNTDKQLAKNLEGTWEGSVFIDDEEIPTDYQFFESIDGTTGKFVEIAYLHEIDGDYDMRYFAYVCGDFSVKDGQLTLTYIPESTYAEVYDEDTFGEYVSGLWDHYLDEGRQLLWDDESELAVSVLETWEEIWAQVCEDRNQQGSNFGNLTVTDGKMSFVAGDKTLEFTQTDGEWFKACPCVED